MRLGFNWREGPVIYQVSFDDHGVERDIAYRTVSYTHLRAHETVLDLVCRLLLEKKKQKAHSTNMISKYTS